MANKDFLLKLNKVLKRLEAEVKQTEKESEEQDRSELEIAKIELQAQSVSEIEKIGLDIIESNNRTIEALNSLKIETPAINIPEIKIPDIQVKAPKIPEIKIPKISIPEIKIPDIKVPEPKVTVNVPEQKAPIVNIPDFPEFPEQMNIYGDVGLRDVNRDNPIPVLLVDLEGRPAQLGGSVSGGSAREVKATLNTSDKVIGSVNIVKPTTVSSAQATTTAGSALQLSDIECESVVIKALSSNTGYVYVGDSSVDSTNGFEIGAGEVVAMDIDNVNRIYFDVSVDNEGVSWLKVK